MLTTRLLLFLRLYRAQAGIYTLKLVSLAIAFACSILVVCFVSQEVSVNEGQSDSERIFRILKRNNAPDYGLNRLSDRIPPSVLSFTKSIGSEVVVSRVKVLDQIVASSPTGSLSGRNFHAVEPSIASVFNLSIRDHGERAIVGSPYAYLSESASREIFGITAHARSTFKVTTASYSFFCFVAGVFDDMQNMHEDFSVLLVLDGQHLSNLGYSSDDFGVYGKLRNAALRETVESQITARVGEADVSYRLQPLDEIYFGPRVEGESARHGDSYSVWILLCISGLITFLAITNYANLTTLTLPARSTEFAISKVAGAESLTVCLRLMQESVIMSALAFAVGAVLIGLFSAVMLEMFTIDVFSWVLNSTWQSAIVLFSIFIVASCAPLYPIVVFSTAGPRRLLSADVISFPRFKRFITTIQLGISISLIVAGLIIERQIGRSLIKEPGRNHDQVVYVQYPKNLRQLHDQKLAWRRSNPNIVDVTAASQMPNNLLSRDPSGRFYRIIIEHDFYSFFDIGLSSGRTFKANDQDSVMVNEAGLSSTRLKPIGIVENFGTKFNRPELPLQIRQSSNTDDYSFLFIRILEVNIRDTRDYFVRFFKMFDPEPVKISFLDHRYLSILQYEDTLNGLSTLLTTVGIAMACCAMLALGLSRINDNLKSIAIRRTFGASNSNIVLMLSREFFEELLVAVLFFGPLTFLFLREWLRNFVYAARFHWSDPLLALAACLVIIIVTNSSLILNLSKKSTSQALRR